MRKKIPIFILLFFLIPIVMIASIYIGLTAYYADSFMYGVFINGIYATGKTPQELNQNLLDKTKKNDLVIVDKFGKSITILSQDIEYEVSYEEALQKLHDKQNPLMWIKGLTGNYIDYDVEISGSFNDEKLKKILEESSFIKKAGDKNNIRVEIKKTSNGYELHDGTENLLNKDRVFDIVSKTLKAGEYEVDLEKSECYDQVELTRQMKDAVALWKQIEEFQSVEITYDMGDGKEEVVDSSVVCNWIQQDEDGEFVFDEKGKIQLDEMKLEEYIARLCDKYDTTKKDRSFYATRGEYVNVPAGTYGNLIDKEEELSYLKEAFLAKTQARRVPIYSQKVWGDSEDDIGDTYIEVDLTTQKMYYYVDGKIEISTDIVTGNVNRGDGTPQKACRIYYKQRNRVLIGEDYRTPVDYWMAVYGNIGIHDAKWRYKFGGTIYKGNGSHGCINTPYDAVSKMYEMAEVGTPVMIFY